MGREPVGMSLFHIHHASHAGCLPERRTVRGSHCMSVSALDLIGCDLACFVGSFLLRHRPLTSRQCRRSSRGASRQGDAASVPRVKPFTSSGQVRQRTVYAVWVGGCMLEQSQDAAGEKGNFQGQADSCTGPGTRALWLGKPRPKRRTTQQLHVSNSCSGRPAAAPLP